MKQTKRVFIGLIAALGMTPMLGYAAVDNGCGVDANDHIAAELALCTTHAYNIGFDMNPGTESERQLMREVIAAKTTVITQQMYKQYEYLDATIRRLKTQLEKAILTTSLQAAGASESPTGTIGAGVRGNDRNVILSGAENCLLKSTPSDGLTCIQNNIRIVLNAVAAGNIGDAKRQLGKDLEFSRQYGVIGGNTGKYTLGATGATFDDCNRMTNSRNSVNDCAYSLNVQVMNKIDERNRENQMQNNRFM